MWRGGMALHVCALYRAERTASTVHRVTHTFPRAIIHCTVQWEGTTVPRRVQPQHPYTRDLHHSSKGRGERRKGTAKEEESEGRGERRKRTDFLRTRHTQPILITLGGRVWMDVSAFTCSLTKAAMKSPPTETGPPNPEEEEKHEDSEGGRKPGVKSKGKSGSEKDSGYSDSSSESLSSEETNGSTSINGPGSGPQGTTTVQTAYTHIYILQNVVLKQSRLLLLQPHVRRHRKRPSPLSYLPILRSYPRIAPRLAPPPSATPSLVPRSSTSPENRPAPSLLEVSLRSLALLRRNLETQRSIRELRAHARLYERALQGEEGGWEHLQRAMEQSGGYPKIASSSETSPEPATPQDVTMTSSGGADTHNEETMTSSEKSMTSSGAATSECTEGDV